MFVSAAFRFLTWTMSVACAARVAVQLQHDLERACDSDHEKRVAELLWAAAQEQSQESTPFASCGPEKRDLPLEIIANENEPVKFCAIGKLAKGGNFFASVDGSILAKHVDNAEGHELVEWGKHAMVGMPDYPGGCGGFGQTLLVEATLSFNDGDATYIVMPNLTYSLELASLDNWAVAAVYDAKPLPNLGKGLVQLFKDVTIGWGVDLPKLGQWLGWEHVQALIWRDLNFLASRVVDFSLFVHVLRRKRDYDEVIDRLEPSKGCIMEPGGSALICFQILDYLTPFTWMRRIESQSKAGKFHYYARKFLKAFKCLGDVNQLGCANYKALASISEAMEVSKSMAKAVFIGTTAFQKAYTCTYETPSLQYTRYWANHREPHRAVSWGEMVDVPVAGTRVAKSVKWIANSSKSSKWLQDIASPKVAHSVGEEFEAHMWSAYSKSGFSGYNAHRMPEEFLEPCIQTVTEFATESYWQDAAPTDMHNVLWGQASEHVIVVRGLPKAKIPIVSRFVNYSLYTHKETVEVGRLNNCFLKTEYMRCDPKEQGGVYFNYEQHFGALEIMVMSSREISEDMNIYLEALHTREMIPAKTEVKSDCLGCW